MQVVVDIPDWLAEQWERDGIDPSRGALEACLADAHREGRLTRGQVREILGLDLYESENWFPKHALTREYAMESYEQDSRTTDALLVRK